MQYFLHVLLELIPSEISKGFKKKHLNKTLLNKLCHNKDCLSSHKIEGQIRGTLQFVDWTIHSEKYVRLGGKIYSLKQLLGKNRNNSLIGPLVKTYCFKQLL
jgi:hypothetical protein